ncbi:hypothetical protein Tco_1549688 [Tanacetum coccineum]
MTYYYTNQSLIITTTTQMQTPLQSPPRSSSQPEGEHIKKYKGKKIIAQKEIEEEAKADTARLEGEIRKEELFDLLGLEIVNKQDFVTIKDLKDFSNAMLYIIQEIFFRRHQGPGVDDHARTFISLLLAEVDKKTLNPLKQMRTIEKLRQ